jgi:putative flippase GtrA
LPAVSGGQRRIGGRLRRRLHSLIRSHQEVLRFLVVGGTCFLVTCTIDYVLKLTVLAASPVIALTVATVLATLLSYVLNREWAFRRRASRGRPAEMVLFLLVNGIAVVLNAAPLWVARHVLGLHTPAVSRFFQEVSDFAFGLLAGTAVAMIFRLWAYRTWVFSRRRLHRPLPAPPPDRSVTAAGPRHRRHAPRQGRRAVRCVAHRVRRDGVAKRTPGREGTAG